MARPKVWIKPPVRGLIDRHHMAKNGYETSVRNFVVEVPWATLQPTKGAMLTTTAIDSAIDAALQAGMRIKLRVGCGIDAPEWVKSLDGEPFEMFYTDATVKNAGESAGTCGRFWTPNYANAYLDLQRKLAAKYDINTTIAQVCITMASTIFGETFLRNAQDPRNVQALLDAGFDASLDEQAHISQMQVHRAWKHTRSSLTFNPYQRINVDGKVTKDTAYALNKMTYFKTLMPMRSVLENYSLSQTRVNDKDYGSIYSSMKTLGPSYDFQTATFAKVGDLLWVLDWAAAWGATSVELPTGYTNYTPQQLLPYADRLAANPVKP